MKSILLFSSGKESLYQLHKRHKEIGLLLMFDYGQKAFPNEKNALEYYSKEYNIPHEVIQLPFFILPPAIKEGIDCNPYVAQRNLVFTSIALSLAESRGFDSVYIGAVKDADEYDGSPYFVNNIDFISQSGPKKMRVKSISAKYTTEQIITSLVRNKVDYSMLWSCANYDVSHSKQCGKCAKCTTALKNLALYYQENKLVYRFYRELYKEEDINQFVAKYGT